MSLRPRFGLSLVELLVVIGVMAVLIGLLAGAVQRTRAAAARVQCQNNLRQLGVAFQNHHATAGAFPIGVTGPANPREPYPYLTWMVRLLPHLEQDALWAETTRTFRQQPDFLLDPPHSNRRRSMPGFSCPLDSRTEAPARFEGSDGTVREFGLTSYLGVMGKSPIRTDGLLYLDAAHRIADITDGASNTLLVGERPPSADRKYGWWYAGHGMRKDGSADSVLGVRTFCLKNEDCGSCPDDPSPYQTGRFDDQCSMLHFWSPHPGGANFLFADGAVRFLAYSADPLMPALASRAGNEAVSPPD